MTERHARGLSLVLGTVAALLSGPALADACIERLAALVAAPPLGGIPYEARATGEIGGNATVTHQRFLNDRHYHVATLEPEGLPDVLHYDGGAYQPDGSGGWSLLYRQDPEESARQIAETRAAQAAGVVSATCGEADLDGAPHDVVEGEIAQMPPFESPLSLRFTIARDTGLVRRLEQGYTLSGMEATAVYDFTPAPDLELPTP